MTQWALSVLGRPAGEVMSYVLHHSGVYGLTSLIRSQDLPNTVMTSLSSPPSGCDLLRQNNALTSIISFPRDFSFVIHKPIQTKAQTES